MSTHKLRHPNFHRVEPVSSRNADEVAAKDATPGSSNKVCGTLLTTGDGILLPPTGQLASYTRECHRRVLLAATDTDACQADEEEFAEFANAFTTNASNDTKKTEERASMDKCIALLEPVLKIFQSSCKNDGEDEDDEVPPQLLRLVRFFHFRWLPMKRALLRRPPPAANAAPDVEVGLQYRLRLARACWKKGLVAGAEYESLVGAFTAEEKRKRKEERGTTAEKGVGESRKRGRTERSPEGGGGDLAERVQASLVRLPTEAIRPERSLAAWRHVKEMISECCGFWDKDSSSRGSMPREDATEPDAPTPATVAELALTSWTALLLSQGIDLSPAVPTHRPPGKNHVASVEKQLATLLSDPSSSASPVVSAVAARIGDLLSPRMLRDLNDIHIYSLGKLLASFHSQDDAEMHVITSIVECSSAGGTMGLEQMARLLAIYSCCISTLAAAADAGDALAGKNNAPRRRTAKEFEDRLRAKLSNTEILKSIASKKASNAHRKTSNCPRELSRKACSFLEAVISTASHIVKCCK